MANKGINDESGKLLLPLLLDLRQKQIVIFGGGSVGERKARSFLEYGRVRVVSLDFTSGLLDLKNEVELVFADLLLDFEKYLAGAFIAVPATNDIELNRTIARVAYRKGILVNEVDGVGDVVVPSIIRKGPITISISTESPALSKYLRLRLEEEITGNYQEMARLLIQIRTELKEMVPEQKDRARIIWKILEDDEIWRLIDASYEKAYMKARLHACQDERDSLDAGNAPQSLHR